MAVKLNTKKLQGRSVQSVYTCSHRMAKWDKAAEQLNDYKKIHQDFVLMDEMAHFTRERIPERVVHAKGAGAFGHFEVTHDISKNCKAKGFEEIGQMTDLAVRFATTHGEKGLADTIRDPRGFSVKFYTDEDGAPNYFPNSFNGPVDDPKYTLPAYRVSGDVNRYDTEPADHYSQARDFYKSLCPGSKKNLIANMAEHLKNAQVDLQERAIQLFANVDSEFKDGLLKALS